MTSENQEHMLSLDFIWQCLEDSGLFDTKCL